MKIGVDAGCLGITDPQLQVGVYQVAYNLLRELGKIDSENEYCLYSFHPIEKKVLQEFGDKMQNIVVRPAKGWMKIWLPLQLTKDKPDVFLGLSQALPQQGLFVSYKKIALLYDIAFETYPDMYRDSRDKLHNQTISLTHHADHLITISEATKNDVIATYDFPEDRISVVYPGVRRVGGEGPGAELAKINTPYFLFVGALKRTKNIPTIISAFVQFLEQTKKEYYLYLVGGTKWYDPDIDRAIQDVPEQYKTYIKFLGFEDDATLASLYTHATAFVSPSFYEGFGLPFVEAMQYGCPVIGSTAGAMPEVVGEAGILVDPLDVQALSHAMERVSAYTSLRLKMKEQGLKQAKQFRWSNFARGVLDIINTV